MTPKPSGTATTLITPLGLPGLRVVEAPDTAAQARVGAHRGVDHAGKPQVDAVGRGAGGLGHDVQPLHRLAEQPPLRRPASASRRDGGLEPGRRRAERGVGQRALPSGRMTAPSCVLQLRQRHTALLRGGGQQHLPRHRAGDAQLVEAVGHGRRAAGDLQAQQLGERRRPSRARRARRSCRWWRRSESPRPPPWCCSRRRSVARARCGTGPRPGRAPRRSARPAPRSHPDRGRRAA